MREPAAETQIPTPRSLGLYICLKSHNIYPFFPRLKKIVIIIIVCVVIDDTLQRTTIQRYVWVMRWLVRFTDEFSQTNEVNSEDNDYIHPTTIEMR